MNIAIANPSHFVKGVRCLDSMEPIAPILHAAESVYYFQIGKIQDSNSSESKNALAYFETIQKIFAIVRLILIKTELEQIASLCQTYKKLVVSLAVAGGSIVLSHFVLNRYFANQNQESSRDYNCANNKIVTVITINGIASSFRSSLVIAHLITKVMKCYLNNHLWPLLPYVGSLIYPFLKPLSQQFVNFSIKINSRLKECYQIFKLSIPKRVLEEKDNCAICLERMAKDEFLQATCFEHAAHEACLVTGLSLNSSATAISQCAVCRCEMPFNFWIVNQQTRFSSWNWNLRFKLPEMNQSLFEKIAFVYTAMQAILSYLLKYPELAPSIFNMQKKLFKVDVLLLWGFQYYLCTHLNPDNRFFNFLELRQPYKVHLLSAITTLLMTSDLVSRLMPVQANTALGQLLDMPDIHVSSSSPMMFKKICAAYFFRILSTSLLAFFTTNKTLNCISIITQGIGFKNILGLRWITLSQTWKLPISHILKAGGTLSQSITPKNFEEVVVEASFLVAPSCELSHFEATCQSIKNCWASLLEGSHWVCSIVAYKIDRLQLDVIKNHFFSAFLIPDYQLKGRMEHLFYTTQLAAKLTPCPCTLPISLTDVAIHVFSKTYGFTEAVVLLLN